MRIPSVCVITPIALCLAAAGAGAQHLRWDIAGQTEATALYGEVTVLATYPKIYYCGANWHPGEPAGGYCGIQDNSATERRTIFSVWDTAPDLHPKTTEADALTLFNRFGGEGEGAHTHMLWPWKTGETFQFFVQKSPGAQAGTTDARYYIYDRVKRRWIHSATINSPNGDKASVSTLSGRLNSFLENFGGTDQEPPRLALYRLWLGNSVDSMKCLTGASGDGMWGTLHDAYFLAAGDKEKLDGVFASLLGAYGKPVFGDEKVRMASPISDMPLPARVLNELKNLPRASGIR